ncbi:cytochrome P450 2D14-like [Anolis sagrei]|uniref:cytochrome P450 2D14-like n=1 Tax=Anolis sagrei TaxID=38937 RepID=UPI003521B637
MAVIPGSVSWLLIQVSTFWNSLTTLSMCLLFLALSLLLDHVKRRKPPNRYPPGPTPLPFFGDLLFFLRNKPDVFFHSLQKKYGPVVSFQFGWVNAIMLNGFKTLKEAHGQKAENFVDRAPFPLFCMLGRGKKRQGILVATCSDGWREQRKFLVSSLKNFGIGKKTFEKRICEEARYLCSEFSSKEGSPFDPQTSIYRAVGNIFSLIALGDRFDYNDENYIKLMHLTEGIVTGVMENLFQFMSLGPWFAHIPGPHQKVKQNFEAYRAFVIEIINEHKKTRDPTCPRDLTDAFLEEIEKAKGNSESSFSEQNLVILLSEMLAVGVETTTATLRWGLLCMILHPDIQKKVQDEIDAVIGRIKPPTMEDQPNMPYTAAVICELQRWADITPYTIPCVARRDTEIDKFIIPKDTIVFTNLSSVLKAETLWEKPYEFYPEHFLDANGQLFKREAFLPFNIGRHACPGDQLAKAELFILLITILQHFTVCSPKNSPRLTTERVYAVTVNPVPFQICAIPR